MKRNVKVKYHIVTANELKPHEGFYFLDPNPSHCSCIYKRSNQGLKKNRDAIKIEPVFHCDAHDFFHNNTKCSSYISGIGSDYEVLVFGRVYN